MGVNREVQGEVTAFLSILFVLLAAFICSIVEVASLHEAKCERRTEMDLAVYSVFGEYQKNLMDKYHVFGIDAGYESGSYSEDAVLGRLYYYGAGEMAHEITDVQLLTDNHGAAFYEQVLYYMETRYGIGLIREFTGVTGKWEEQMIQGEDYYEEKENILEDLQETEAQTEAEIGFLAGDRNSSVLEKVLPQDFTVSSQAVVLEEMPSLRALNKGRGSFTQKDLSGFYQKLLFDEYILQNFSNALKAEASHGLAYETEYVIAGKRSDRENLEEVVKKLVLLRFAADYVYLLTDEEKKAEARSAALAVSTLILMPELAEGIGQALLLLWAYRESQADVRNLLSGGKVPVSKTRDTWQVPLSGILSSENEGQGLPAGAAGESGLAYEGYLRMLLFLGNREKSTMRCLDMIETTLRTAEQLDFFRIDLCIAKIKIKSTAVLRQGITYDFPTQFAYQ